MNIANIITLFRIPFSIILLFFPVDSFGFYSFYLLAGLTDVLDGIIARKTNNVTDIGSKLDTFSDFIFVGICLFKSYELLLSYKIIITIVLLIKLTSAVYFFMKTKKLISIHSALNKLTGIALFILPFIFSCSGFSYYAYVVSALSIIASLYELYLVIYF